MASSDNSGPGPDENVSRERIAQAIRESEKRAATAPEIADRAELTNKTVYKHLDTVVAQNDDIHKEKIGNLTGYWSDRNGTSTTTNRTRDSGPPPNEDDDNDEDLEAKSLPGLVLLLAATCTLGYGAYILLRDYYFEGPVLDTADWKLNLEGALSVVLAGATVVMFLSVVSWALLALARGVTTGSYGPATAYAFGLAGLALAALSSKNWAKRKVSAIPGGAA